MQNTAFENKKTYLGLHHADDVLGAGHVETLGNNIMPHRPSGGTKNGRSQHFNTLKCLHDAFTLHTIVNRVFNRPALAAARAMPRHARVAVAEQSTVSAHSVQKKF